MQKVLSENVDLAKTAPGSQREIRHRKGPNKGVVAGAESALALKSSDVDSGTGGEGLPAVVVVADVAAFRDALALAERARSELVVAALPVVEKLARKYRSIAKANGIDPNELYQEGSLGLMEATDKFDPEKNNASFATYAAFYARNRMRVLLKTSKEGGIKVPRALWSQVRKLLDARDALVEDARRRAATEASDAAAAAAAAAAATRAAPNTAAAAAAPDFFSSSLSSSSSSSSMTRLGSSSSSGEYAPSREEWAKAAGVSVRRLETLLQRWQAVGQGAVSMDAPLFANANGDSSGGGSDGFDFFSDPNDGDSGRQVLLVDTGDALNNGGSGGGVVASSTWKALPPAASLSSSATSPRQHQRVQGRRTGLPLLPSDDDESNNNALVPTSSSSSSSVALALEDDLAVVRRVLESALNTLSTRQATILRLRFGIEFGGIEEDATGVAMSGLGGLNEHGQGFQPGGYPSSGPDASEASLDAQAAAAAAAPASPAAAAAAAAPASPAAAAAAAAPVAEKEAMKTTGTVVLRGSETSSYWPPLQEKSASDAAGEEAAAAVDVAWSASTDPWSSISSNQNSKKKEGTGATTPQPSPSSSSPSSSSSSSSLPPWLSPEFQGKPVLVTPPPPPLPQLPSAPRQPPPSLLPPPPPPTLPSLLPPSLPPPASSASPGAALLLPPPPPPPGSSSRRSRHTGVSWDKQRHKWRVYIYENEENAAAQSEGRPSEERGQGGGGGGREETQTKRREVRLSAGGAASPRTRRRFLGSFDDEEEAAACYRAEAERIGKATRQKRSPSNLSLLQLQPGRPSSPSSDEPASSSTPSPGSLLVPVPSISTQVEGAALAVSGADGLFQYAPFFRDPSTDLVLSQRRRGGGRGGGRGGKEEKQGLSRKEVGVLLGLSAAHVSCLLLANIQTHTHIAEFGGP